MRYLQITDLQIDISYDANKNAAASCIIKDRGRERERKMESWADIDENDQLPLPPNKETVDKNGIKTIVTYAYDKKKRRVKTTRKVRVFKFEKRSYHVEKSRRANWKKFGDCEGLDNGPENNITYKYQGEPIKMEDPNVVPEDVRFFFSVFQFFFRFLQLFQYITGRKGN